MILQLGQTVLYLMYAYPLSFYSICSFIYPHKRIHIILWCEFDTKAEQAKWSEYRKRADGHPLQENGVKS